MDKIPIVVISGPTASGKTGLSISLSKDFNGEVVSADSMQIYKYMDIGTAKPDIAERSGVTHHMIDILNPDEDFSVAQYVTCAHDVIKDIKKRKKLPIVVGGTGLYINSLVDDIDFLQTDSDPALRDELQRIANEQGIDVLVEELKSFDEVSAQKIHKNNERRIIRAIEFYKVTGIPISLHQAETKKKISRYEPCMIAIRHDMDKLYKRIEERVDQMVQQGLLSEVKALIDKGYENAMLSMQGIGYKEILEHLKGEISFDEAVYKIKIATRHYAKRQMTWFRRDNRINWIDYDKDVYYEAKKILEDNGF